jgi:hypothetical protein
VAQTRNCSAYYQDKLDDNFPISGRSNNRPEMHIRGKAELTRRCCAATVEAGAWRCHHCGEAHPTSELRAVVFEGGLFLSARDARAYAMCSRKIFAVFQTIFAMASFGLELAREHKR